MEIPRQPLPPNVGESAPVTVDVPPLPESPVASHENSDANLDFETEDGVEAEPEFSAETSTPADPSVLVDERSSERPIEPSETVNIFEDSRRLLLNIAGKILRSSRLDPSLADDVVSDAALYAYDRYVVKATPVSESRLRATLVQLVHSRAIDLIRKEMLVLRTTNNYYEGAAMTSDGNDVEGVLRWGVPDASPEEQVFQQAHRDRLLTLLAGLMLRMTPLQREAIFHTYRRTRKAKSSSVSALESTGKSHLLRARQKAVQKTPEIIPQSMRRARGRLQLTREEARAMLLAGADALDTSEGTTYSPDLNAMKNDIIDLLYPEEHSGEM